MTNVAVIFISTFNAT